MVTAYCVKCKKKDMEMQEPKEHIVESKGVKRRMMKGKCPDCGTTMCRIMGKKD